MRYTRAIINLKNIRENLSTIKRNLINPEKTSIIAVVKANAYGHGLIEIAKTATDWGTSHLAVAIPEEGLALRQAQINSPIILLGLIPPHDALLCVQQDLIVTVCQQDHLPPLIAAAKKLGKKTSVLIKFDTGMNRIGTDHQGVINLAKQISALDEIEFHGLFTHFASAGGPDLTYAKMQAVKFQALINDLQALGLRPPLVTTSASSASFTMPHCQFNAVRAGIAMYGLYSSNHLQAQYPLNPALKLVTNIAHLKKLPANQSVGYEMTYHTEKECYIATLPVGYGDGYSRSLSNKARVLINDKYYPLCGNVCMDQMMVCLDVENKAQVGDEVVLIGTQGEYSISLEELAQTAGTINYELACAIAARVPRKYVNN